MKIQNKFKSVQCIPQLYFKNVRFYAYLFLNMKVYMVNQNFLHTARKEFWQNYFGLNVVIF